MIQLICILFILISCASLLPTTANNANSSSYSISKYSKYEYLNLITYIVFGIVLIYITGFRAEGIDRDYYNYKDLYSLYSKIDLITIEPSFIAITKLVNVYLNDNVKALFIIYALISISIKLYAIRQLSNFWALSLLVYISYSFPLHDLTQIRAGVAVGFILLTIKPLYEKKPLLFLIFSTMAVLFHFTAIIVLPLWFLNPKKINVKMYFAIVFLAYIINNSLYLYIANLIGYFQIEIITNKIVAYQDDNGALLNIYNAWQIMRIILGIFFLYKIKIIYANNKYSILLLKYYIISTCAFVILSSNPSFAGRISDLLAISDIIMLPCIVYVVRHKPAAKIFVISIAFSYLFLNLFFNKIIT